MENDQPKPSPLGAEFRELVMPLGDAMSEGRFEDARSVMFAAIQYITEHVYEEDDSDIADECDAERRGDFALLERLYLQELKSDKLIDVIAAHWKLGKLYEFLGQEERAAEQGRKGLELSRDHEVEMLRVMSAVRFARLSKAGDALEVERALRSSLSSLPVGPIYVLLRAQALAEIAWVLLLQGNSAEAVKLVGEALATLEPQRALADLPGHQWTIARAWQVRAFAQTALGDNEAATVAWTNAVDLLTRWRLGSPEESPRDADQNSRFLYTAVEGLTKAGRRRFADEILRECNIIRAEWELAPLGDKPSED